MKLVLEILTETGSDMLRHRAVDRFPLTVGRGFGNDIILTDPHVDAQHLRIDAAEGRWTVSDLGSANGLLINGQPQHGTNLPLRSGDTLHIGQTEIRIHGADQPVAAALPLQKPHPLFSWLAAPRHAWLCFILALLIMAGWTFLEVWSQEPRMTVAAATAATAGIIVVWSALWAVAGRLISHRPHFRSHAALICLYLVASVMAWYINSYAAFLFNENGLAEVVFYGTNFILLAGLLYGSLFLATRIKKEKLFLSASVFSAGILAGFFILGVIGTKTFSPQPVYPSTLQPYLAQLAPGDTLDGFMRGNEELFATDIFKETAEKDGD